MERVASTWQVGRSHTVSHLTSNTSHMYIYIIYLCMIRYTLYIICILLVIMLFWLDWWCFFGPHRQLLVSMLCTSVDLTFSGWLHPLFKVKFGQKRGRTQMHVRTDHIVFLNKCFFVILQLYTTTETTLPAGKVLQYPLTFPKNSGSIAEIEASKHYSNWTCW